MNDNVEYLPIWKKDATAEERFLEMAMIARKHPLRFKSMVIMHEEIMPDGNSRIFYSCNGLNTKELLGLVEFGKQEILRVVKK